MWLDALFNYLTVSGFPEQNFLWPPDCQVIGMDILKFHAIIWPAILFALNLEPPKTVFCHSHWLAQGRKMSKSIGNVVDPFKVSQVISSDGLRYFLLREGRLEANASALFSLLNP